jgi:hypothetical protein
MNAKLMPGVVLVYFRTSATEEEIRGFVESLELKLANAFAKSVNGYVVDVPVGKEGETAELLKTKKDWVETAAPNYIRRTC